MGKQAVRGLPVQHENTEFMFPSVVGEPPKFREPAWPATIAPHLAPWQVRFRILTRL